MKERLIKWFRILLVLLLILGLFVVGRQSMNYKSGQQDYNEAEQLANLPEEAKQLAPSVETVLTQPDAEDPYATALREEIDLSALKAVNRDVQGWIDIPGTEISYPVLQGTDNDFYLNHTWKKDANSVGSVFLECKVDPKLTDFNTIIYGHRMRDLSMFGSLKYYTDISYWEEHPSVYVVIEGEVFRYDIYAAYKADPEDIIYGLKINSRPKKQELVQFGLDNSMIETGIVPTTYDRILTLSTCTGSGHASRWVVQAVNRVDSSRTPENEGSVFEGTDDVADSILSGSADSLTFSDKSDVEQQPPEHDSVLKALLLTGLCVCFVVLLATVIAAAILYSRKV